MNENCQKIKILLLSRSNDYLGGIVNYFKMFIRHLDDDLKVHHFTCGKHPEENRILPKLLRSISDMARMFWILIWNRYDVVHINPSMMLIPLLRDLSFVILFLMFGYKNRILIFFHGWDIETANRVAHISIIRRSIIRLLQSCGLVVVLSHSFQQSLVDMGFPADHVLVTTTMYERSDIPMANIKDNDTITILFMARFVKEKGLYIAGKVAKALKEEGHQNLHFIFAGDGPEMPKFMAFIRENDLEDFCEVPGYVRGREKNLILARSHILLLPTFSEGLPIVILEAMGSGLAVVSTMVGAIPEVVIDGINGFLHKKVDESCFTSSIRYLMHNIEPLREIRQNNIRKAERYYEASKVSKNMIAIYKCLSAGKNTL